MRAASLATVSADGGDERGAQQQVFGRVAGDRQLGEHHEVAALGHRRVVRVEHALRVAVEVTHDGVELGDADAQPDHLPRITTLLEPAAGSSARHFDQ